MVEIIILNYSSSSSTFSQVMAEDVDQGQNGQVTYSIQSSGMSGLFKIDPVTGSITTSKRWLNCAIIIRLH